MSEIGDVSPVLKPFLNGCFRATQPFPPAAWKEQI
jgi:hypothetical protein